ncbi:piezo-type mechanosensitive ion channel component 2-like [Vombatus ursinus]|uniref:piezo-type mechanosensitive ion channel component 2-like n=1 Tax=Vombatus ursinus TaxID=29139 RepID=UPI000FFD9E0E|nr:piezo-type mechanosensitive ion channel component 2-like [Vombatus ursinus]
MAGGRPFPSVPSPPLGREKRQRNRCPQTRPLPGHTEIRAFNWGAKDALCLSVNVLRAGPLCPRADRPQVDNRNKKQSTRRLPLPRKPLLGSTKHLLRAICYTSAFFLLIQVASQMVFRFMPPDGAVWEVVLGDLGILRFSQVDARNIIRLLGPDIGMLVISLVIIKLSQKLVMPLVPESTSPSHSNEMEEETEEERQAGDEINLDIDDSNSDSSTYSEESVSEAKSKGKMTEFLGKITTITTHLKTILDTLVTITGKVLVTLLLGLSGIIYPSLTSAVYFVTFLVICSWWSCHQEVGTLAFSTVCVSLAIFTAGHIGSLYLYQLPYFQDLVPPEDIYARLLGMTAVIKTNRTESWKLHSHPGLSWPEFANPLILLLSYYVLIMLLHQWNPNPKISECKQEWIEDFTLDSSTDYNEVELNCIVQPIASEDRTLGAPPGCNIRTFLKTAVPLTVLPSGSWQVVPLLKCEEYKLPSCGVDSPAFCDSEHGSSTFPKETEPKDKEPSSFSVLGHLIMSQSYVTALIIMMVWSITHNSWLTFVLLIWSCIIWMARNRRRLALLSSPFLVIYANILILLNFFVALKVSQEELFPGVSTSVLIDFDLKPYPQPCFHIGVKYMTERQSLAKAKEETLQEVTGDEHGREKPTNTLMDLLGSFITGILVKYWIFLCGSMFFIVSFDGKVVVYKILYIMLFLACVALYQIHYGCWRQNLKYFWMAVVFYSMVVLITVYGYQFKTISGFLIHTLGLSEEGLRDIGLEQFDTVELFAKIMLPAAFLLACILQLHYFNEDFLKITSLNNTPISLEGTPDSLTPGKKIDETQNSTNDLDTVTVDEKQKQEENEQPEQKGPAEKETRDCDWMIDKLTTGFLKLLEIVNGTQVLLWRLLEIHIIKVVSTVIIWVTLQEVSFMNCLFYIVWVFALPYSTLRLYASHICTVWACVMVICKMMYQLKFVKPLTYSSNCTEGLYQNGTLPPDNLEELQQASLLYISPIDPAYWFGGLRKCDAQVLPCLKFPITLTLQNHLTILALMATEATVYRHQKFYRHCNQLKQPLLGSIFDGVTRKHLDDGLLSSVKYFINYGFYKFGLEMCFVAVLNVTGQRMDFYSLVHICSLIYLLCLRRRKAIAEAWPRYCGFLASLMTFQYFLCVGIPPAFCKDYPWRSMRPAIHSNLIKWLYLPDFAKKPDAFFLLYDFLLLLFASLQWQVFEDENKASVRMEVGDNVEISQDLIPEDLSQFTPVPNFIYCRSYLDTAKVIVFRYHFWFVLCLVFLTGTTRINILCAGYLVAFFYFMLRGRALLLRPMKIILHWWDCLITYTALVIAMKNLLSIGACTYLERLLSSHCWFVHSFSIYCTIGGYSLSIPDDEGCEPPEKEAGILWDAICFTFLLIQRRIFTSYYHLYVVADLKATEVLASRGAEMFDLKLRKFLVLQEEEEEKSKLFMMKQMEKIKLKQKKIDSMQQTDKTFGISMVKDGHSPKQEARQTQEILMQRIISMVKFSWVFGKVLLEGTIAAVHSLYKENWEITTVLRMERCMLLRRLSKGEKATKENILRYYHLKLQEKQKTIPVKIKEREPGAEDQGLPDAGLPEHHKDNVHLPDESEEEIIPSGDQCRDKDTLSQQSPREGFQLQAGSGNDLAKNDLEDLPSSVGQPPTGEDSQSLEETPACRELSEMGDNYASDDEDSLGEEDEGEPVSGLVCQEARPPYSSSMQARQRSSLSEAKDLVTTSVGQRKKRVKKSIRKTPFPLLTAGDLLLKRVFYDHELEEADTFYRSLPQMVRLTLELYKLIESKSEMLCYFVIILNHMISASILTLVLPILCFLWAMLSVPRPPKRFWMAAIFYTEATVVVKYFSQFGFFPWTTKLYAGIHGEKPFSLPNIAGIEKKSGYVHYDLVQLLALFYHRSVLKSLGLWDEPSSGQANCKEKKKIRKSKNQRHSSRKPGNLPQGWQAELHPPPQPAPSLWAFWRKRQTPLGTGEFQDRRARKIRSWFRKFPVNGRLLTARMLKKQLVKSRKLATQIALQIYWSIRQFFYNIVHPEFSPVCDVYAFMFLVEGINFLIIIFGYWAFGKYSAADFSETFSEDQVPEAFLAMILIQFGSMIVDRAIYLRKTVIGKCIFQVVLVIGVHFWLFFILPEVTKRRFSANYVAQIWYLVKCIYFGLSAYQIKCGYPSRILGNFLTKNFNFLNLFLFQGFRIVPFLLELRAVMDWIWTDTALSLSSWICLEDLYASVFIMKCWKESEKKYPHLPGQQQKKIVKYGQGGVITLALVFLMWFPLVFMSLLKSVGGVTNQPLDVSIKISISGYETLFTMSSQQQNLIPFSQKAFDNLTAQYAFHPAAMQFISNYHAEDITVAKIKSHASLLWNISPANRAAMITELSTATAVYVTLMWTIQRTLPGLIPKALRTTAGTEAKIAHRLEVVHSEKPQDIDKLAFYRNITIRLQQLEANASSSGSRTTEWWVIQEWRPSCAKNRGCSRDLEIIIYNDKVSPQSLGFLAGYGIVGLYVSVVMVIAKFIREHFNGISRSIMYEELPNVDRILKLCTDIFLVREMGDLEQEEQLFSKLIFLYRSPETMIKWTREAQPPPQQPVDQ